MNRFQGFTIPSVKYDLGVFTKTECNDFRVWVYPFVELYPYEQLLLNKCEQIDLPYMDVYEIRANAIDGQIVGYAFDCTAKNFNTGPNFLQFYHSSFSGYKEKDLQMEDSLKFRYQIKDINLFSIEGRVATATIPSKKIELDF